MESRHGILADDFVVGVQEVVQLEPQRKPLVREGIGHGGTYMQPHGGEYATVASAWLKWWLKGDMEAGKMFTGSEPGVGKLLGWTYERKNIQ